MLTITAMFIGAKFRVRQSMSTDAHEITLEGQGFSLKAVVIDGRPGVRKLFADLPVQMCHFHQKAIITRYLTRRPKLEAGKELREIVHVLCNTNEQTFTNAIDEWLEKWKEFLKERTVEPVTGRWHYTHKRLRSAHHSLRSNLPYLFTYQKYPELNIPNTTNSLDGSFAHLKGLIQIHRGLKIDLKRKLVLSILQNRHRKSNYANKNVSWDEVKNSSALIFRTLRTPSREVNCNHAFFTPDKTRN